MYHYTYQINYSNGMKYIGVRSSECLPELDTKYVGSSAYTDNELITSKEILKVFETREQALLHEIEIHELYDVARSSDYYNKARQTSTGFDTTGIAFPQSEESKLKRSNSLKGRKRPAYIGENLSKQRKGVKKGPHTAETKQRISEANKGQINTMKGLKYSAEEHVRQYSSRTKYDGIYTFKHQDGRIEQDTCMNMGIKYGVSIKPTRGFRDLVKGACISHRGWTLVN